MVTTFPYPRHSRKNLRDVKIIFLIEANTAVISGLIKTFADFRHFYSVKKQTKTHFFHTEICLIKH